MYGSLLCLPVLTGWTACARVSVCALMGDTLVWICLFTAGKLKIFLFEANVVLCNLIPAAL